MIKNINIKSEDALQELTQFKDKQYVNYDIRLRNVCLIKINELLRSNLFYKNDLFVNSDTLWSLMQEGGEDERHHHHGLTPNDILEALNNIQDPYCIFKTKHDRISIILLCLSHYGEPLMMIIEIGSGLINDTDANVNKLVTMHPKSDVERKVEEIDKKRILYLNRLALPSAKK